MGRTRRFFRQSNKSMSGTEGARNFNQTNRGTWHERILNFIKVRGKSSYAKASEDKGIN
ncbi:hypothetical protein HYW46_03625 [Candidatus Daviesbacteria bacterium]|nr:hypothetical protein [Candidatus Daviesbacteria bacterium]